MTTIIEAPSGLLNIDPDEDDTEQELGAVSKHRAEEPEPEPEPRGHEAPDGIEDGTAVSQPAPRERQAGFPEHWRARTLEEREEAFQAYARTSEPYFQKIRESGETPWHGEDTEDRRHLFLRRYRRPQPPAGMPSVRSLREFNQEGRP